jgi:DNA-binding transcriptional MerR regulator
LDEVMMSETYNITELAREFEVTTRTIRFYEDQGLISPQRQGQTRIYQQRDYVRLRLILRGKRLGFSLAEIKEIINMYDAPSGEVGQLQLFLDKISARRVELEQMQRDLDLTLGDLDDIEKRCEGRLSQLALPHNKSQGEGI